MLGLNVSGSEFRVSDDIAEYCGLGVSFGSEGLEAPVIRLIIASLREIPTDLIVIARGGTGLRAATKRFEV